MDTSHQPPGPPPGLQRSVSIRPYLRSTSVLAPYDSVEQAVERLRHSPFGQVPVVSEGRIIGLFTEECLRAFHAQKPEGLAATEVVERIMRPVGRAVPDDAPPYQALALMEASGQTVMPVVGPFGHFVGMVTRSDLVAVARGLVRPERAGGMATPLGVYLTTGVVRAGAGDLGLFLTGVLLTIVLVIAAQVASALAWALDYVAGTSVYAALVSRHADPNALAPNPEMLIYYTLFGVVFLVLFRVGPLGGYHAAEHMTVNALERGEELISEKVALMPRAHPRCGTNIAVVFFTVWVALDAFAMTQVSMAFMVLVLLVSRTTLGGMVQQWVTTRPPRCHELANGVSVGRELMSRYQLAVGRRASLGRRVWNMGMPQVLAGLLVTFGAINLLIGVLQIEEYVILPF